jgi:hypothetical protein
MALESAPGYLAAGAYWRSERRLRARMGSRVPLREHLPDGEVHWPDPAGSGPAGSGLDGPAADGPDLDDSAPAEGPGAAPPWAGECWAIEAELTRKTVRRTAAIMAEILTRTGDYGCLAAETRVPGAAPRHARVLYLCSAAARPTVIRARDTLPGALAARVEIRGLPADAALTAGPSPAARPASSRSGGPSPARASPASSSRARTSRATQAHDGTSPAAPPRDSEAAT